MGNEHSRHSAGASSRPQTTPPASQSAPPPQHGQFLEVVTPGDAHFNLQKRNSTSSLTSLPPGVTAPPGAELIGPYVVESVLGKGSFAEVKLGRHLITNDKVALKIISKGNLSKGKRRIHLQREIRFMKLLSHPYIGALPFAK